MKSIKFFAIAAMAISLTLSGCKKDKPEEPGKEKSTACLITAFTLDLGTEGTITGTIANSTGKIQLKYKDTQATAIKSATAEVTVSPGATISPNPETARDYSQPVEFTVTAEDGKTTKTYTTASVVYVPVFAAKATSLAEVGATAGGFDGLWDDSGTERAQFTAMGVSNGDVVIANSMDGTTKVFDGKTLAAKGSLNMTLAIPSALAENTAYTTWWDTKKISWLGNDEKGHLVAVFNSTGKTDGTPVVYLSWNDGWNNAPTYMRNAGGAFGSFMSVGGDVTTGASMITIKGGGLTGTHNLLRFNDGVPPATNYIISAFPTGLSAQDGSWGQQISPASSNEDGTWFLWDSVAGGSEVYTWTEQGAEMAALGSITMTKLAGPRTDGWGNYTHGGIKAFTFNGVPMALVCSTGWPSVYVSIVDDMGNFTMTPDQESANATLEYPEVAYPIPAYYYNETEEAGYAYVYCPSYGLHSWKITLEEVVVE